MLFRKSEGRTSKVVRWAVLFLCTCVVLPATAQPRLDARFLSHQKAVIERWLDDAGLAGQLEVLKLRLSAHPDPKAGDRQAYRLELRFRTVGTEEAAQTDFQKFLDSQAASSDRQFPEQFFYRLVHLLGVNREFASVHFYALETEYAVYFDLASRELVMQQGVNRSVRRTLSVEAPANGSLSKSGGLTIRRTTANQDMLQSIRRFLEGFFGTVNKGPAVPPKLEWRPLETDYLEVSVSGMKGQVLSPHNYWEKLSLSVEVRPGENGWKLVCYFDGLYASGLGSNPPEDEAYYLMEKSFRPQLDAYADQVLSSLQQYLEQDRQ